MSTPYPAARMSPEMRAGLFHFTVFTAGGAASVYLPIWLSDKGISPEQIGIINAVPVVLLVVVNLFIGRLADRASDWRQVLMVLAIAAGVAPLALFFANSFWVILVVWTALWVPAGCISPLLDAATLRMTKRSGKDFGVLRGWGTVGYVAGSGLTGLAVAWLGPAAFVPLFVFWSVLRAVISLQLPRFRGPGDQRLASPTAPEMLPAEPAPARGGSLKEVLKPWFVLPLLGFSLLVGTHTILTAFAALIWKEQGLGEELIGPLFAVGAAAEAAMMFVWTRLGGRISARHMILAAALVAAIRWFCMALGPPIVPLFLLQLLHATTFAVGYFGAVHFIANWTDEKIAAEAQSLFFVMQQAVAVVVLVATGWLVGISGNLAFVAAGVLSLAGALCVVISLRLMPVKRAG